jgi:L-ascorbate metabolism protein UlaG (beta-lactamase superfamily)
MAIKLTWYGHTAFALDVGGTQVLVDPFLTDNRFAPISAGDVEADYILVTHGHGDHIGDAVAIAKRTGALVISNFEICTMGPDDALRAVKLIEPRAVIPIHYDTFDVIVQDPHAWAERVRAETSAEPVVLKPGESYEL